MSDTYGPTSETPLAQFDPVLHCWKMSQAICLWGEQPLLETLPKSGMTVNGKLYRRLSLVQNINENGYSLWPTPTVHGEITQTRIEAHRRRLNEGMKYSSRITQAIALRYPKDIGYLSPMWTELLMGFPEGWTDLEDLETQ